MDATANETTAAADEPIDWHAAAARVTRASLAKMREATGVELDTWETRLLVTIAREGDVEAFCSLLRKVRAAAAAPPF
ncbi:hypothetical protein [Nonomuraea salmonea]|uniref:Uncharacterized protein n=1 Tax=Nonomuraea salmonea TaxID=46181 RepID=A0ABV5P4Q7_9ACTN